LKRAAIISVLVACGAPQASQSHVVMSALAPEARETDDVDRDPGHDEPEDRDHSRTEPRSPRAQARRHREPEIPREAPILETLEGRVSYYSDRLEGRSTASGEPYRLEEFTAASRDLPFGTLVRVVRLSRAGNEELGSVVVRVNDRGPFGDHRRILDLSRAAAEALDMVQAGVVPVRAEILRRGR
jgi:rare lipoprotein A (peptidoglycan hydrolase)